MSIIIVRSAIVFMLLNLGLRLTGKRQIGELEVSELITTLLLSELAAAPISDPDIPFLHAIAPIFFLTSLEVVLTFITSRHPAVKRIVDGRPAVVIRNGHICQSELALIRMSVEELLSQLRSQGIGDVRDVRYALFEQSGQLSAFKKRESSGSILNPIICNGKFCKYSADIEGLTYNAVKKSTAKAGYKISDYFLYAVDEKGAVYYILKEK